MVDYSRFDGLGIGDSSDEEDGTSSASAHSEFTAAGMSVESMQSLQGDIQKTVLDAIRRGNNPAAALSAELPELSQLEKTGMTLNGARGSCTYCAKSAADLPSFKLLTCARCKSAFYCNVRWSWSTACVILLFFQKK
jgi:hypothetical protein